MKADYKTCNELREKFNHNFKAGLFSSLHDTLWQIAINGSLGEDIATFHVNISEGENELVIAFENGGYKSTGVLFEPQNYNDCCEICEELNELFFQIDKEEQATILAASMSRKV